MGTDISNIQNKPIAQVLLDKQVPAFDITTAIVCRDGVGSTAAWKRGNPSGDIWSRQGGYANRKGQRIATGVDGNRVGGEPAIGPGEVDRERVAQETQAVRIGRGAGARADYQSVGNAVGNSQAG